MMPFEFMYGDSWYKYEDGWILKQNAFRKYNKYSDLFCPVHAELAKQLDSFSADQLRTVMGAIVHSYVYGKQDGRNNQIKDFKRLFNID